MPTLRRSFGQLGHALGPGSATVSETAQTRNAIIFDNEPGRRSRTRRRRAVRKHFRKPVPSYCLLRGPLGCRIGRGQACTALLCWSRRRLTRPSARLDTACRSPRTYSYVHARDILRGCCSALSGLAGCWPVRWQQYARSLHRGGRRRTGLSRLIALVQKLNQMLPLGLRQRYGGVCEFQATC